MRTVELKLSLLWLVSVHVILILVVNIFEISQTFLEILREVKGAVLDYNPLHFAKFKEVSPHIRLAVHLSMLC